MASILGHSLWGTQYANNHSNDLLGLSNHGIFADKMIKKMALYETETSETKIQE